MDLERLKEGGTRVMSKLGEYGELIYTRAGPAYDWKGMPLPSNDGYAVYQLTQGLFDGTSSEMLDFFREKAVQSYRYNMNGCPAESYYAYTAAPKGDMALLGRFTPRTREECDAAEEAGVDSRASHVAQFLAGCFERHPYLLMDSPFYTAHQRPIAAFYGKTCAPRPPMMDAGTVPDGPIRPNMIQAFLQDDRQEAVQLAVSKLLEQNDLPPGERKMMIIQDSEPNVRLWISAITSVLPLHVARKISFCTCARELTRAATFYSYALDKHSRAYSRINNLQDQNAERHMLYDLAGCVPGDRSNSTLPKVIPSSMPLLLIDGAEKRVEFDVPDNILQSRYIQNIGLAGGRIAQFTDRLLDMVNLPEGAALCRLFEVLLKAENWMGLDCRELGRVLNELLPYFDASSSLMRGMLDELILKKRYEHHYMQQDTNEGFPLLQTLSNYAGRFHLYEEQITGLAAACLENVIGQPESRYALRHCYQALTEMDRRISAGALKVVAGQRRLQALAAQKLDRAAPEYLDSMLHLVDDYAGIEGKTWKDLICSGIGSALWELIKRCMKSQELTRVLFGLVQNEPGTIDSMIISGATALGNRPSDHLPWWRTLLEANAVDLSRICAVLVSAETMGAEDVEAVLAESVRQKGCRPDAMKLYRQYLSGTQNTGNVFCTACMDALRGAPKEELAQSGKVLLELLADEKHDALLEDVLVRLDKVITLDTDSEDLTELVSRFGKRNAERFPQAALWRYVSAFGGSGGSSFLSALKRDGGSAVSVYLKRNPRCQRFTAPANLLEGGLGQTMLDALISQAELPGTHLVAMQSFTFQDPKTKSQWMSGYAGAICRQGKYKGDALAGICALLAAVQSRGGKPIDTETDRLLRVMKDNQVNPLEGIKELYNACVTILSRYKPSNAGGRTVENCQMKYGTGAAQYLETLLTTAQERYEESRGGGIGKIFGGFFKGRR